MQCKSIKKKPKKPYNSIWDVFVYKYCSKYDFGKFIGTFKKCIVNLST